MNVSTLSAEAGRSDVIQVLRFIAASLVLLTHTTFYYHEHIDSSMPIWREGGVGVPIFFVISGFVMVLSSNTLTTDTSGAREFMTRRLLRIVPLYWLVTFLKVLIALAVPATVMHKPFEIGYVIQSLFFIPTLNAAGEVRPFHSVGWTLLHEMFFYLTFAASMALRFKPQMATSVVIVLLWIWGIVVPPTSAFEIVITQSVNLCFVCGMLLGSAVLKGPWHAWASLAAMGVCLSLAAVAGWAPVALARQLPDLLAPVLGCVMLILCSWRMPRVFRVPIALGDSSYALYLFHPMLARVALLATHRLVPGLSEGLKIAIAVLLAVAVAHGIHLVVERPLNRWAQRLVGRRARRTATTGQTA